MSVTLLHSNASPHHVGQAHRRIETRDSHKKIQLVIPFVGGLSGLGRSHEVWQRILEARTRIMGPSTRPSSSGVKNSPCRSTSTHHLLFPLAIPHCRSLSFNSLNVGCALFHSIIFFVSAGSSTWISSMIAPQISQTIVINKLHILMSSAILVPAIRFLGTKFSNKDTTL